MNRIRALLSRKGRLSQNLIDRTPGCPGSSTIRRHFRSYVRAYESIGYTPPPRYLHMVKEIRNAIKMREGVVTTLRTMFPGHVTVVRKNLSARPILRVDGTLDVSVLLCRSLRTPKGRIRWQLPPLLSVRPVLLCRLDATNRGFHSFCLLRQLNLRRHHRLQEGDPLLAQGLSLADLSCFYETATRLCG